MHSPNITVDQAYAYLKIHHFNYKAADRDISLHRIAYFWPGLSSAAAEALLDSENDCNQVMSGLEELVNAGVQFKVLADKVSTVLKSHLHLVHRPSIFRVTFYSNAHRKPREPQYRMDGLYIYKMVALWGVHDKAMRAKVARV